MKKAREIVCGVDITNLLRVKKKLDEFSVDIVTERDKAGAIQSFEYTYEISWKAMKRCMDFMGRTEDARSPKSSIRVAADYGLISDPRKWFKYIELRNLSVHTYNEDCADKVLAKLDEFRQSVEELITNLRKLDAKYRS